MYNKFQNDQDYIYHPFRPIRKIRVVIEGFYFVLKKDFSVTYKFILSIMALVFTFLYRESIDGLLVFVATGYMLSMEIMNSCIELMCDFFETGYNPKIKLIKDTAATSAGISILVWLGVIGWEVTSWLFL